MRTDRFPWALVFALLMFPQVVETAYSPALPSIAGAFAVSAAVAGQTLSVYFAGFAVGVLVWGIACDRLGRRNAMLAGLACYALGVGIALCTSTFGVLMAARALAAFGAAAGSIVTQTLLRDHCQGPALATAFARAGLAIALSPALGVVAGAVLAQHFGHAGVFAMLWALAMVLLIWAVCALPQDACSARTRPHIARVFMRMVGDGRIRLAVLVIAAWNLQLFGFYEVAPFAFARWGLALDWMGGAGVLLAAGALGGALLNTRLLAAGWQGMAVLRVAMAVDVLGVMLLGALYGSGWALAGMVAIAAAFALAIPHVLGTVLADYADCRGTAGALLGLAYYLLLALGLVVFGWGQSLLAGLAMAGVVAVCCSGLYSRVRA